MTEAKIALRNNSKEFAVVFAVFRNSNGRVTGNFDFFDEFGKRLVGLDVRVGRNKARLVHFNVRNHRRLVCDSLRAVNKRNTAFFCKRDCQLVIRD